MRVHQCQYQRLDFNWSVNLETDPRPVAQKISLHFAQLLSVCVCRVVDMRRKTWNRVVCRFGEIFRLPLFKYEKDYIQRPEPHTML